jgi:hypothetical protein
MEAFDNVRSLLRELGLRISEAEYAAEDFGSWFVTLEVDPPLRVVWDGKDGWLIVERLTDRGRRGEPVWENLWIARDAMEQTAESAVAKVRTYFDE